MTKFKVFLFLSLVFLTSCAVSFAQDRLPFLSLEEIRQQIDPMYRRDIVSEAKNIIYKYYGRKNFNKPEWIRVKNFLTWIEGNKDNLNKQFATKKIDKLSKEQQEIYMGAFLGANYVTKQMINKYFDLPILLSDSCHTWDHNGICIFANDFIDAINGAMHEAAHMFPLVDNPFAEGRLVDIDEMFPEELAIFSQLKYGLPMKPKGTDIRIGTRATFISADENFIKKHLEEFSSEYAEIVFPATKYSEYSNYNMTDLMSNFYKKDDRLASVDIFLRTLVFNTIRQKVHFDKVELSAYEMAFFLNPVYKETLDEIMPIFRPDSYNPWCEGFDCYPYLYGKTRDECYEYLHKLFNENLEEIITIFYLNLKKHTDKNIPPTPNGYI